MNGHSTHKLKRGEMFLATSNLDLPPCSVLSVYYTPIRKRLQEREQSHSGQFSFRFRSWFWLTEANVQNQDRERQEIRRNTQKPQAKTLAPTGKEYIHTVVWTILRCPRFFGYALSHRLLACGTDRIRSFVLQETVGLLWRIHSYRYFSLSSVAAETGVKSLYPFRTQPKQRTKCPRLAK